LELREDLELLEQRLMQTQNQIEAIAAQLQVLTADVTATQSQWVANYAAEAQSRAEYQRQMLGLQQESRNILRELADLRRQQHRNGNPE
jgi:phage-related minor tail protein